MSLTGNAESGYILRGKLSNLDKINGLSAYEVAVANGFSGTEEEWLASLEGRDGVDGKDGTEITSFGRTAGGGLPGTKDTYTMNLSDGRNYQFDVYNGADGAGAGDMTATVYDPQGKKTDIYQYADNVLAAVPEWAMQSAKPTYTASEVGAAPAGYGLGMMWNLITDFNDTSVGIGWYTAAGETAVNYPSKYFAFAYGIVRIERRGNNITQTAISGPYSAVRLYNGSTWGEWNYVNPPMELGVEYRTTERHLGKPVYCKIVELGTLPNTGTLSVPIADSIAQVTHMELLVSGNLFMVLDSHFSRITANASGVMVITKTDASTLGAARALVKYTKTTD